MATTKSNVNSFLYSKSFIVVAVVFSILVTVFVYFKLRDEELRSYNLRLDKTINVYSSVFSLKILSYLQELNDIKRFYNSTEQVGYDNFVSFVAPLFKDKIEIQALEWIPKISHEKLTMHEAVSQTIKKNYFVWQQDSNKNKIKSLEQEFYYPVLYVYPLAGNDKAIGFNLNSNAIRRQALNTARDSGQSVATESLRLIQHSAVYNSASEFLIFTPYYRFENKPVTAEQVAQWTVAQRRDYLTGFILGVFEVSVMFESAIQYLPSSGFDILVVDVTDPDEYELLYTHRSRLSTAQDGEYTRIFHGDNLIKREFRIAGREWFLIFYPTVHYFNEFKHNNAIILLGVGLLMSILLLVYLLTLRYRMLLINSQNEKYNHQLLNSEIKQRAVIETIADALIVINNKGVVESFNPAAVKLFGYEVDEIVGENVKMLMPDELGQQHDSYLLNFVKTGQKNIIGVEREVMGQNKNGTTFPLVLSVKEMVLQGELKFTGVMRDISEQKNFESQLILAKELAEAGMKTKHDFLATMSHEIRTPMNGVLGMMQLLLETELSNEQREYVNVMSNSGQALLEIINDILDFSKMDAGQLKIDAINFDLEQTLFNVIQLFSQKAQEKNIHIIFNYSLECPKCVLGDPNRIRQVVMNLVGNALKFTEQGHIYVFVKQVHKVAAACTFKITVQDTGVGISEKALPTLFDSFTQADSSTTRHYGGTGLGLAISKQLVELMSGELGVSSELDVGSTFWFLLVLDDQDQNQNDVFVDEIIEETKVVIVDYYDFSREQLKIQLSGLGAQVCAVSTCQEALDRLVQDQHSDNSQEHFDALIIDQTLVDNEVFDVIAKIRSNETISNLGIILLSSQLNAGDAKRFKDAGGNAYFTKPVLNSVLYQAINAVSAQTPFEQQPLITVHTLNGAVKTEIVTQQKIHGLVLIVEDNEVNTLVIQTMLARFGIDSIATSNGQLAISSWSDNTFDLILMDCQMPVLDGYQATAEIRKIEQQQHQTRIPIIALTANVMLGDKEKCLSAGMDDFLAKPIEKNALESMLHKWLNRDKNNELDLSKNTNKSVIKQLQSTIDMSKVQELNELMGGAMAELVNTYLSMSSQALDKLQSAVVLTDSVEIQQLAHNLKGASGNVGAVCVMQLSSKIEQMAMEQQLDGVDQIIDELLQTFAATKQELKAVIAK